MKTIQGYKLADILKQLSGGRQKPVFEHLRLLKSDESETVSVISEILKINVITTTKALNSLMTKKVVKREKNISNHFSYSLMIDEEKKKEEQE
jgi:predicted transcriptional regulator